METGFKTVEVAVPKKEAGERQVDVFVSEGATRVGRYQIRTNTDGSRDVYYSDIEGSSFTKTRKVPRPADLLAGGDVVAASIDADLARRGLRAPGLAEKLAVNG